MRTNINNWLIFVLGEGTLGVHIRAQKSADKTLFYLTLRSSTTYLPNN